MSDPTESKLFAIKSVKSGLYCKNGSYKGWISERTLHSARAFRGILGNLRRRAKKEKKWGWDTSKYIIEVHESRMIESKEMDVLEEKK